jgi:hypothetical protein
MPPSVPMRARYHPCGEAASEKRPPAPTHVIRQRRDCQRRRSRRPCVTATTDRPREQIAIYTTYGKRGTRAFRMSSSATGYCSERPRDTAPGQHGRRGGIRTRGRCFAPRTTGRPRRCRHGRPCGERAVGPPPSAAVLFDLVEGLLPGLTRVVTKAGRPHFRSADSRPATKACHDAGEVCRAAWLTRGEHREPGCDPQPMPNVHNAKPRCRLSRPNAKAQLRARSARSEAQDTRAEQGTTGCARARQLQRHVRRRSRRDYAPSPAPAKLGVERSNDHELACAARRMTTHEMKPAGTHNTDPNSLRHRLCAWRGAIRFPLDERPVAVIELVPSDDVKGRGRIIKCRPVSVITIGV